MHVYTSISDSFESVIHPSHKMQTMLVAFTNVLRRQLDRGGLTLLLLLDLPAAFNTVSYDLLTHYLADAGIWGSALQ